MMAYDDYDSFYFICAWIAKRKKIKLKKPAELPQDGDLFDFVNQIAEANNIRIRKIGLYKQWWRKDAGPLVGFYQNQACALMPAAGGGYERIDVKTGMRIKISNKNAAELSSFAFYFYPALPVNLSGLRHFFRWILARVKKDFAALLVVCSLLNTSIAILPLVMIFIFNAGIVKQDLSLIGQLQLLLLVNLCAFILFYKTQAILNIRLRYKIEALTIPGIWDKVLRFPLRFFRQFSTGDTVFRINAITEIQNAAVHGLFMLVANMLGIFFLLILLFLLIPSLALFSSILVLIFSLIGLCIYFRQFLHTGKIYQYFGQYLSFLLEIIAAIIKVRVTDSMDRIFHLWLERLYQRSRAELAMKHYGLWLEVLNACMLIISPLLLLVVLQNRLNPPALGILIGFSCSYFLLFLILSHTISSLGESLRIFPLWKKSRGILTGAVETGRGKIDPGILSGEIELKNIDFGYHAEEPPLFKNLSLSVRPGEFIAVVGPSGSGKSTLFRLVLGFEEPESGEICFNGINSHFLKMTAVRKQIGVVIQNSSLIPGSIYANIRGNHSKMTRTEAWEIAEKVGLTAFIKNLPMQLDTLISEGAVSLSGGEIQRIILARALAQKPKILILDEATSALDNTTQAVVQNYLRQLKVTQIIAAHRLSTIVHADRIIVVDRGNIVQIGRFDELIQQPGLFSQMAKRQLPTQGNFYEML